MKYGNNYIEWQTSIHGIPSMSLSDIWTIWGKEKDALNSKILSHTPYFKTHLSSKSFSHNTFKMYEK